MAELNPNIILQANAGDTFNPSDALTKAMTFRDLASRTQLQNLQVQQAQQEFNDNQALRNARSRNSTVDNNGNVSVDRQGMFKDLAQTSPSLLGQAQQQFAQQDMAIQKNQIEQAMSKNSFIGQLANGVTDQNSWNDALSQAQAAGINTSNLPRQYDPAIVNRIKVQTISANDYLKNQIAQQEANNRSAQLKVDLFKTYGAQPNGKIAPDTDPATLVQHHVPPDRQQKVYDEIGAAQATAQNAPKILQAFDNAVAKIKSGTYTPEKINSDIGAMQVMLGPTFKDIESTVRQAAMDNLYSHVLPTNLDRVVKNPEGQAAFDVKRQALVNYLLSKKSAPTAMGNGIDLSQFKSTTIDPKILSGPATKKTTDTGVAKIHPALQGKSLDELLQMKAQAEAAQNGR